MISGFHAVSQEDRAGKYFFIFPDGIYEKLFSIVKAADTDSRVGSEKFADNPDESNCRTDRK